MDNYTSPTDYDVLIEDDFSDDMTEPCHRHDDKAFAAQFLPPFYSLIFILGLVGNALLVLILVKYKGFKEVVNIYFLNTAVSNFLFVVTLPFWIHNAIHSWELGDTVCKMISGFYSVGYYGYTCFLLLLIVHRYLAIVHVGRFHIAAKKTTYGIITSTWGIAVLAALPEFLLSHVQMESKAYICHFVLPHYPLGDENFWKQFLTLKINILGLLIPLLVAIYCYGRMKKTSRYKEKKYGLFRLIFVMALVFMGLWTPYNLVLFLRTFQEHLNLSDCESSFHLDRAVQATKIIANTHCCINPVVHMLLDGTFCKHLYCLFHPRNNAEGHLREVPEQQLPTTKGPLCHSTSF
ncbi:C-C chemokine receptor-like 2 [Dromiciops gliroides]|uniref:C-C chemokine receptor-like 2 n=1 Tax=Dromiciops gliroides TaxID=33562 RepID=UPI001CC3356C|nr:C-C chemokine receptor-like 2 [Dromiciops gliroides]XP_043824113.1 C-C chemokine receptor-like 2 [Dromiciops gliroides]XP_043824115.1 C-C chemokine receptor-like 2 [Dromiciops gliroides]XP_043824116.1 C-C chemokine receptor-like 2 [Dromiciops gliroides]